MGAWEAMGSCALVFGILGLVLMMSVVVTVGCPFPCLGQDF